jgi:hypothetical protein
MGIVRIAVVVIVAALTAAMLPACIFSTRDAEEPGSGGSPWVVPNAPTQVFTNMRTGLEDLTGVNYKRSIQDAFEFIPLPEDASDPTLVGAFDDWTATVEKEVTDRLLASASSIRVTFTNLVPTFEQTPYAYYNVDYVLVVGQTDTPPDTLRAKAEIRMQDGSKGWQMIRWQDIERVSGYATWGYLRGTLRQQ